MSLENLNRGLVAFWFEDLPPMDGALRIMFYGLIFFNYWISLYPWDFGGSNTSPWTVVKFYDGIAHSGWFSFEGLGVLMGTWWVNKYTLYTIHCLSFASWACVILGFGGQIPVVVLAVTTFILFAFACAIHGVGHRWYAPVYAFIALTLSQGNSTWSLDAHLHERFGPAYPWPQSNDPVLISGLGRKLAMTACVSTMFGGILSKMWVSGLKWLDGRSLAYYTQINTHGRFTGYLPWLKTLLCEYPLLSRALAIKTFILQSSAILVLFIPQFRIPFIVVAWGFHIGIWMTMNPQYLPQACCYFLGMQWWWEASVTPGSVPLTPEVVTAAQSATVFALLLFVMCVTHFELWPFTCVPMYSPYRDLRTFSHSHFANEEQAFQVAESHRASRQPTCIGWADAWVQLRLTMTLDHPEVLASSVATKAAKSTEAAASVKATSSSSSSSSTSSSSASSSVPQLWECPIKSVDLSSAICNPKDVPSLQRKHLRRTLQNAAAADIVSRPCGLPSYEALRAGVLDRLGNEASGTAVEKLLCGRIDGSSSFDEDEGLDGTRSHKDSASYRFLMEKRAYLYCFPSLARLPAWTFSPTGVALQLTLTCPAGRHVPLASVPWSWTAHRAELAKLGFNKGGSDPAAPVPGTPAPPSYPLMPRPRLQEAGALALIAQTALGCCVSARLLPGPQPSLLMSFAGRYACLAVRTNAFSDLVVLGISPPSASTASAPAAMTRLQLPSASELASFMTGLNIPFKPAKNSVYWSSGAPKPVHKYLCLILDRKRVVFFAVSGAGHQTELSVAVCPSSISSVLLGLANKLTQDFVEVTLASHLDFSSSHDVSSSSSSSSPSQSATGDSIPPFEVLDVNDHPLWSLYAKRLGPKEFSACVVKPLLVSLFPELARL